MSVRNAALFSVVCGLFGACASAGDAGGLELELPSNAGRADATEALELETQRASDSYVRIDCGARQSCETSLGADWRFDHDELEQESRSLLALSLRTSSELIPVVRISATQTNAAEGEQPLRCPTRIGFVAGPIDAAARDAQLVFAADGEAPGPSYDCALDSSDAILAMRIERVDPAQWRERQMTFRLLDQR